jgi:hypothetical protein
VCLVGKAATPTTQSRVVIGTGFYLVNDTRIWARAWARQLPFQREADDTGRR